MVKDINVGVMISVCTCIYIYVMCFISVADESNVATLVGNAAGESYTDNLEHICT